MVDDSADDRAALDDFVHWLAYEAPPTATIKELLHGFALRLDRAGFELLRVNLQIRPLNPQVEAIDIAWSLHGEPVAFPAGLSVMPPGWEESSMDPEPPVEGGHVRVTAVGHGGFKSEAFRVSPFFELIFNGKAEHRRNLTAGESSLDSPILKDLALKGATDYIALALQFYRGATSAISFTSRRPGGFTDSQITVLRDSRRALSLALSPRITARALGTLLGAYVGPKTARLVLAGAIERGNVQEIDAAIWFSDLRGFTPMSEAVAPRELIGWLNDYFAAVGSAIAQHDGEILKFMGDAILAIWPVSPSEPREATCRAALSAARAANIELEKLNASRAAAGLPPMRHGIGLHVGSAQYGNIGTETRLDFTVIGPAVNTTSRLEGLCSKLSRQVIASSEFAQCLPGELRSLGMAELKGVSAPQEVFGFDEL